jgi:hypothetical protein
MKAEAEHQRKYCRNVSGDETASNREYVFQSTKMQTEG